MHLRRVLCVGDVQAAPRRPSARGTAEPASPFPGRVGRARGPERGRARPVTVDDVACNCAAATQAQERASARAAEARAAAAPRALACATRPRARVLSLRVREIGATRAPARARAGASAAPARASVLAPAQAWALAPALAAAPAPATSIPTGLTLLTFLLPPFETGANAGASARRSVPNPQSCLERKPSPTSGRLLSRAGRGSRPRLRNAPRSR